MSVFGRIVSAIFGQSASAAPTGGSSPTPAPGGTSGGAAPPVPSGTSGGAAAPASTATQQVDVAAVLDNLAKNNREKLDWKRSIVDLLKLLDIDSSLSARKELAKELNYTGDTNDSATMNVWLHKQVLKKLEENGGKVPADLKD